MSANSATATTEVLIFCDSCDASVAQKLAETQKRFAVSVIPLSNGPELAKNIRTALCARRSKDQSMGAFCCVNWCSGDEESTDRADAAKVADLLENTHKAPFVGNPHAVAKYDVEDVRMLMFYSELPCTNFSIVKGPKDMKQLSAIVCPADVTTGKSVSTASDGETLANLVSTALFTHPVVLVTEAREGPTHSVTLLVKDGALYSKPSLKAIQGAVVVGEATEAAVATFADTVVSTIMGKQGHARVSVHVSKDGALTLCNVVFNIPAPIVDAGVSLESYLDGEVAPIVAKSIAAAPRHIVSFDTVGKGYFMRAARDIKEGEVVFEDERRAFAIVTREHVAKTWSDADKYTFSRYAWPLDADCHVYAIWEDDPKRWRPINHSCDPNLVFAEGHSLNVIARRAISERDDLTLDYSTFCDYTMKPFECFCKSPSCRGTVTPGQVPAGLYGTNAWFRREPPQVTDLVPKSMQ